MKVYKLHKTFDKKILGVFLASAKANVGIFACLSEFVQKLYDD